MIGKNHTLFYKVCNQGIRVAIMDIGGHAIPTSDKFKIVQQEVQLTSDNPELVGKPLFPSLLRRMSFMNKMDYFDPVAVDNTQQPRLNQETLCPILESGKKSEQVGMLWQSMKELPIIPLNPTLNGLVANAFQSKQDTQSDDFA
jgi:hypothetical protein